MDDRLAQTVTPGATRRLALDRLVINPRLVRRLPPELAFQYHALPLAEDNRCITVAMADPDDAVARTAIAAALGARLYVVRADPASIDSLLAETWPEASQRSLHLLVHDHAGAPGDGIYAYAQYLCHLLDGHLTRLETQAGAEAECGEWLGQLGCGYDLVIVSKLSRGSIKLLFQSYGNPGTAQPTPKSVLIAPQPRWPLKRILLVTHGCETDEIAVDWITRLAQPSHACITVLAIVAEVSAPSNQKERMPCGLADWLATDTALGQQLQRIAQRLVTWGAIGRLHFRQGSVDDQIRCEVAEGDYDLIVTADAHPSWYLRELPGEAMFDLLSWMHRPVLLIGPTIP